MHAMFQVVHVALLMALRLSQYGVCCRASMLLSSSEPYAHIHTHSHTYTHHHDLQRSIQFEEGPQYTHIHTPKERMNMVRRDGAEVRKERIQEIARIIQASLLKNSGGLSLKQTVATLQCETGLTSEKIMEYLVVLENLGRFTLDKEHDTVKKIEMES